MISLLWGKCIHDLAWEFTRVSNANKNLLKVPGVQLNPGTEAADFSKNCFASAEPPLAGFVFLGRNVWK